MELKQVEQYVAQKFKNHPKRYAHTKGVEALAMLLAEKRHVNPEKARIAALIHDYCKYDSLDEQIQMISDPEIIKRYESTPVIYHAYAAGSALKCVFDIHDDAIYSAIVNHVWGRPNMSELEQILVVADFCEINRHFIEAETVRSLLETNFNEAVYWALEYPIRHLITQGITPHQDQIAARDYYESRRLL